MKIKCGTRQKRYTQSAISVPIMAFVIAFYEWHQYSYISFSSCPQLGHWAYILAFTLVPVLWGPGCDWWIYPSWVEVDKCSRWDSYQLVAHFLKAILGSRHILRTGSRSFISGWDPGLQNSMRADVTGWRAALSLRPLSLCCQHSLLSDVSLFTANLDVTAGCPST